MRIIGPHFRSIAIIAVSSLPIETLPLRHLDRPGLDSWADVYYIVVLEEWLKS